MFQLACLHPLLPLSVRLSLSSGPRVLCGTGDGAGGRRVGPPFSPTYLSLRQVLPEGGYAKLGGGRLLLGLAAGGTHTAPGASVGDSKGASLRLGTLFPSDHLWWRVDSPGIPPLCGRGFGSPEVAQGSPRSYCSLDRAERPDGRCFTLHCEAGVKDFWCEAHRGGEGRLTALTVPGGYNFNGCYYTYSSQCF